MATTSAAIDRYLAAFENGTLDPEDLAGRLVQLKATAGSHSKRKALIEALVEQVKITGPGRIIPFFASRSQIANQARFAQ